MDPASRRRLVVACLAATVGSLDTIVNIALPAITAGFGLAIVDVQWLVIAFVLTYACLLLVGGRLADRFGYGRLLVGGGLITTVAFVACSAAPNYGWFLAGRVLQGVGNGFLIAAAPAAAATSVGPDRRGWALGWFQAATALGVAIGPLLGGLLLLRFDWQAVFAVRAPLAAAFTLAALSTDWAPAVAPNRRVDATSAGLLSLGLGSTVLVASRGGTFGWTSPATWLLAVVAVAGLASLVRHERRSSAPVLELGLLRQPAFVVANLLNLLANGSQFAIWLLTPYYLLAVRSYSTTFAGLLLATAPLTGALAALGSGRLSDRAGPAALCTLGLTSEAVGLFTISRLGATAPTVLVVLGLALVGLGSGLFQAPNQSFVMGAIASDRQGVAGAISQLLRTLGIVSAAAGFSALVAALRGRGVADPATFLPAARTAFVVAGCIALGAAAVSLVRTGSRQSARMPG